MMFVFILCTVFGCSLNETEKNQDTASQEDPEVLQHSSVFMMPVSETEGSWEDLAYLSSIPTSAHLNSGHPSILTFEEPDVLLPATVDLLQRLAPPNAYVLNTETSIPHAETTTVLTAENASQWSKLLIEEFWQHSSHLIIASSEDYSGAILASSLASFLDAPLLFSDQLSAEEITDLVDRLQVETVLAVRLDDSIPSLPMSYELLADVPEVFSWLHEREHSVQYLTISNPTDRQTGRSQKSSMMAPVYAARNHGISLAFSLPMPADVVLETELHPVISFLDNVYEDMGYHPDYLAIVGAHDALPLTRKPSIFDNPETEHPVSDLPYGETDDDPFLDIAIGRIVGDTVAEMTATATRTSTYPFLMDGVWEKHFVESGLWGFDELRPLMLNVGFAEPEHLSQSEIEARSTLEVAAILHKDHSYCQVLGNAFDLNTTTLFAPSVIVSRGCSVGGIDLLRADQRSIVDHLFGHGAVAFVGASRNSIAYNTIIEVSMWNQLLNQQSIGQAFKHGINDAVVHWQDEQSAAMRYSLDIEILYGDPALTLSIPESHATEPAKQILSGQTLDVLPPEEWTLIEYHPEQLLEWGYTESLFMFAGSGASPMTYWSGSYDSEDMYFGVQVLLNDAPASIEQQDDFPAPLGWSGQYYLDWHQDGSVTSLWRVRLLDFNENTGDIVREADRFEYNIQ